VTALVALLAAVAPTEDGFRTAIPADWLQGRTAYGGLSTALAYHAATACAPDLSPLRSAQVAFIGPLSGDVTVKASVLRRGRNAAFIQSDVISEAGLGVRATFVFMAAQPSRIALDARPPAGHVPPAKDAKLYTGPAEFFTGNFNFLDLKDAATSEAEWLRWGRLREREGLDPVTELLAVADGLPPAAYRLFGKEPVPISSLTWIVNLLVPLPHTDGGWGLLSANSAFAQQGCSSQAMRLWNASGELVAEGMQSVAIFG